jgi:hypothetical protein
VKGDSIVEHVAREVGCSLSMTQAVMTAGLRALHRHAFCEAEGTSGAILECFLNFGAQAAYHLGGLLEQARVNCDPDLPWSETLMRIDSDAGNRHRMFVQEWVPQRSPARKLLDEQGPSRRG